MFGVKLYSHEGLGCVLYAFVSAVVDVREPRFPSLGQGVCSYSIAVVLGGDEAPLCSLLEAGLVLASVSVFKLIRIGSGRQGHNLVPQADAECGDLHVDTFFDKCNSLQAHLGIARAVGDNDTIECLIEEIEVAGNSNNTTGSFVETFFTKFSLFGS